MTEEDIIVKYYYRQEILANTEEPKQDKKIYDVKTGDKVLISCEILMLTTIGMEIARVIKRKEDK